MCRTGGRRCPSSRPAARGGTRGRSRATAGQQGDTAPGGSAAAPPPGGNHPDSSAAPPPRPAGFNYAAPTATVGGQYQDAHIHGGITLTPGGIVITGPITGTPSAEPTPAQAAAAEAAAARAVETAREAARAARESARTRAPGDTANVAGDGDVIALQIGGRTYRY